MSAGLDVARGLAVLGMFGAHLAVTTGELSPSDPSTWLNVVHGRSSILFAVVAGCRSPYCPAVLGTGIAVILEYYAVLFVLAVPFLSWRPTGPGWTALRALGRRYLLLCIRPRR